MSDGSFPSSPPPPPPVSPIISGGRPWWQSWWLITALAVLAIVGGAALIAAGTGGGDSGDDDANPPATDAPTDTAPDPTDAGPTTTDDPAAPITPPSTAGEQGGNPGASDPPITEPAATTTPPPTGDVVDGAPAGSRGSRLAPVPAGEIADLGDGWRLQVLGFVEDGTSLVLAENQFNDPPRDGTKFTLVDIALGYYGFTDPANAFIPNISGLAAASVQLDEDCGVIPGDFRAFADVFTGGVLQGTVCFVTTPADDGTVQLYATSGFDGPDVFLQVGESTAPPAMPTLLGPQPGAASTPDRLDPIEIGTPVDVGEGWTLTVTAPATDITDIVAAENQFNDPPPEGARFVGIDVEYRYDGEGAASAFEVSTKVVGASNVEILKGCGVVRDPVDTFVDVFGGGTIDGTLCFVTPVDDVGTLVLYASTGFGEDPLFFSTGGSASPG